jgi:hypothetical protein
VRLERPLPDFPTDQLVEVDPNPQLVGYWRRMRLAPVDPAGLAPMYQPACPIAVGTRQLAVVPRDLEMLLQELELELIPKG